MYHLYSWFEKVPITLKEMSKIIYKIFRILLVYNESSTKGRFKNCKRGEAFAFTKKSIKQPYKTIISTFNKAYLLFLKYIFGKTNFDILYSQTPYIFGKSVFISCDLGTWWNMAATLENNGKCHLIKNWENLSQNDIFPKWFIV